MSSAFTQTERGRRIAEVIDYLFKHSAEDLSLGILAGVAHYSPDHLQNLFKQAVGETPKQYSLKLRLETAFLILILQPGKPLADIALDCGFSSPAVFSRAMRSHFGHSPEQLRALPHRQRMTLLHDHRPGHASSAPSPDPGNEFIAPEIQIVRRERVPGVYQLTTFDDPVAIRGAFRVLSRFARSRGLQSSSLSGILAPLRRNSYRAFLPFAADGGQPFPAWEIAGGTFASFFVTGDLFKTRRAVHYFGHRWLPVNGYNVAGFEGFETFAEDPAGKPYFQLQRQIYIPIEPA